MMLYIKNLSYSHPDKNLLFQNLNLTVNPQEKIALVGDNGVGKSTLLRIISRELPPALGEILLQHSSYLVPQISSRFNHWSIAQALTIDDKLQALYRILEGEVSQQNYDLLNDDWGIEERIKMAFDYWELEEFDLDRKLGDLSGGQKTKVFLSGIQIHQPELVLLDEPSNHLDVPGRKLLYDFLTSTKAALIVVSHDKKLLNYLPKTTELEASGITLYGGNFDFYQEQKQKESQAKLHEIQSREKALKSAKEKERKTRERQQKLDVRAKKNLDKAGLPKIVSNSWKDNAEKSTSKITEIHAEKVEKLRHALHKVKSSFSIGDKMKLDFEDTDLHEGKTLFLAKEINFKYPDGKYIWKENLSFQINSGERIHIRGVNGSGKTTLIRMLLGQLKPQRGSLFIAENSSIYLDQDYSLIDDSLSVWEQAERFNIKRLQEHEVKIRLVRFLFTEEVWGKPCGALSGGERMRLALCCLNIRNQSPDSIVLDEPTNNLDIRNVDIFSEVLSEYRGTLLVISHDESFLKQLGVERIIAL